MDQAASPGRADFETVSILAAMAKGRSKRKTPLDAAEFGRRLRSLREASGLSQRELADRIHTRAPQVSRYETGAYMPNAETLATIADVLHVDLDKLLLGRENGKPGDDVGIKDVRLLERLRELEKLDRQYRETAIAMLDALIFQGTQEAVKSRLVGSSR
jgi:transcriptional regulator with XRE-family HTH domain